jgi:hypothetical protein
VVQEGISDPGQKLLRFGVDAQDRLAGDIA